MTGVPLLGSIKLLITKDERRIKLSITNYENDEESADFFDPGGGSGIMLG